MVGLKKWLLETHGQAGLERLLAALPTSDHATWDGPLLIHTSQHPADLFLRFGDAVLKIWAGDDRQYIANVGAYIAMNDLASYMKVLMKLGTPAFVASRFGRIWSHYFSAGEMRTHQCTFLQPRAAPRGSMWQRPIHPTRLA